MRSPRRAIQLSFSRKAGIQKWIPDQVRDDRRAGIATMGQTRGSAPTATHQGSCHEMDGHWSDRVAYRGMRGEHAAGFRGLDAIRDLSAFKEIQKPSAESTAAWKNMGLMRRAACWTCLKPQTEAEATYIRNLTDTLNVVVRDSECFPLISRHFPCPVLHRSLQHVSRMPRAPLNSALGTTSDLKKWIWIYLC